MTAVADTPALARLVADFLREEVMPALSGNLAFRARVAAGALDLIVRRLERESAAETAEQSRLQALLARDGDLDALNAMLCDRIQTRAIGLEDADLLGHLRATLLDRLAIDQPGYAALRQAEADWRAELGPVS
jgi:hypothetical protein